MRLTPILVVAAALLAPVAALAAPPDEPPVPAPVARNAVYAELGGPGLLYTVNYERFLLPRLSVRAGCSLFGFRESGTGDTLGIFTLPLTTQVLLGGGAHHLELGLGLLTGVMWSALNSHDRTGHFGLIAATATIGYRYQPPAGGLLLRVALTPFYGGERFEPAGLPVTPWGSVGAGYVF